MPRNGSGTYVLPAGNPTVTGTTITTAWSNGTMTHIGNELTNSIAADGQKTPTANLPMGGFKFTNVGAPGNTNEVLTWGNPASVTTLTASGATSLLNVNLTGTTVPANGWYLPAANVPALANNSTPRIYFTGVEAGLPGNAGTARGWGSVFRAIELGNQGSFIYSRTDSDQVGITDNSYFDGSNWKYVNTNAAAQMLVQTGSLAFSTSPSGTAGTTATPTVRFAVSNTGTTTLSAAAATSPISASIGGSPQWTVDGNGRTLMIGGSQPMFRANRSASNQSSGTTVIYDNEVTDQGSNYNNATGVFTAPVAGVYFFMATGILSNTSGGSLALSLTLTASSAGTIGMNTTQQVATGNNTATCVAVAIARLNASETVSVSNSPTFGAGQVLLGSQAFFYGFLLG